MKITLVTKEDRKIGTSEFVMAELPETLIVEGEVCITDEKRFGLDKAIELHLPLTAVPEEFLGEQRFREHECTRHTSVSPDNYKGNISMSMEVRDSLVLIAFFDQSKDYGRLRSDVSKEPIRAQVRTEFNDIDFLSTAKREFKRLIQDRVDQLNKKRTEKLHAFFDTRAPSAAEKYLNEEQNPEWIFLLQQEESLRKQMELLDARKATIRKNKLIEVFEADEKPFSEPCQEIAQKRLYDADGIESIEDVLKHF